MRNQIAVVSGASSFLGSGLIEKLICENVKVYALCRLNSSFIWRLPKNPLVIPVEYELSRLDLVELPEKCDVFYHFAWSTADKNDFYLQNLNVKYTLDGLHLAKKLGCSRFLFAGSQAEYGLANVPLDETVPCFPVTGYGMAKLCAGQMAQGESKKLGISFIWTRILSVYGENDNPTTLYSYLRQCFRENIVPELTSCEQIWDYLSIEACSEQLWRLTESEVVAPITVVGSGIGRPLKDFVLDWKKEFSANSEILFGVKEQNQDTPSLLVKNLLR